MAILSTIFSFLIIQFLISVTSTKADPKIDVHPSEITPGLSSSLDINCSFFSTDHPEMAAFASLILSRSNMSGQEFQELVGITEFSPDSVTLLTHEKVTATGVHSQTGETFLHLTWDFPTETQAGVYQCVAHGIDTLGHPLEMVNVSTVTEDEANLNNVLKKLKQMELRETVMENTMAGMEKRIQALEYNNSLLCTCSSNLEHNVTLEPLQRLNYMGFYKNHDYYFSKEAYGEINSVMNVCKSYGGYLVEIDSESEFIAIKEFLNHVSVIDYAVVAGTDEASDGIWLLQSTNTSLPFTIWTNGGDTGTEENCLILLRVASWNMDDIPCDLDPPRDYARYICEIPRV